jgi:hypothetical protein
LRRIFGPLRLPRTSFPTGETTIAGNHVKGFALLGDKLLAPAQLAAMKTTVPAWKGVEYGLGIMPYPTACGVMWGNGGDIAGYSNTFINTEDGPQAGVMADTNPAPEGVDEARGGALHKAMADALHRESCWPPLSR